MAATELRQRHNPSRRMALQLFVFYIRSEKKCGLLRPQEKALSDLIWYDDRDLIVSILNCSCPQKTIGGLC